MNSNIKKQKDRQTDMKTSKTSLECVKYEVFNMYLRFEARLSEGLSSRTMEKNMLFAGVLSQDN